jgi:hypothetical protein
MGLRADEPLWLEEKKAQRVSYHEATIFALRQAGIHVEPHWFGPVKCAPISCTPVGYCKDMLAHCIRKGAFYAGRQQSM